MSQNHPEDSSDLAAWIVKKDRGLSESEASAYRKAVEENPDLAKEEAELEKTWKILDRFPSELADQIDDYDLAKPFWRRYVCQAAGIAAALVIGTLLFSLFVSGGSAPPREIFAQDAPKTHRLADNSVIRLNANSSIKAQYSNEARHVHLLSGEAHFTVAKDVNRPFTVFADQLKVTAVGTAFNVRLQSESVEVLVTEGIIELDSPPELSEAAEIDATNNLAPSQPWSKQQVFAGQLAFAAKSSDKGYSRVAVSELANETIETVLSWQSELLTLGGETLDSISKGFEQKTGRRLIIADSSISEIRIGGRFPSDNPMAFLQVLENNYAIPWEELSNGDFVVGRSE